jgi:hypothetical protein
MKKSIVVLFLFVFSLSFSFTAANFPSNNGNKTKAEINCPYLQNHVYNGKITCPYLLKQMKKNHDAIEENKLETTPKCPYLERNKNFKSNKKVNHPVVEFRNV